MTIVQRKNNADHAIDLLTRTRSQKHDVYADLAVAHLIIAQVTLNRLDLAAAYDAINTAMSYAVSTDKRTYAKMYVVRGRILRLAGYPEEAMEEFNAAIRQFVPEFIPERLYDHPASTSLPAENTIFEAMEGKADALSDLYAASGDPALLVSGVQAHRLAFAAELRLRRELSTEVSRNILAADSRRRTGKALAMLAQLQQVRPRENAAQMAFDLMETTKAIAVWEELTRRHQDGASTPDDPEAELTKALRMHERALQMLRRAGIGHREDHCSRTRGKYSEVADRQDTRRSILAIRRVCTCAGYDALSAGWRTGVDHVFSPGRCRICGRCPQGRRSAFSPTGGCTTVARRDTGTGHHTAFTCSNACDAGGIWGVGTLPVSAFDRRCH
jgi:tetratricopeptide (TPR) repeat protein